MSLHVPAHPAGAVHHHLLRNALLAIGLAVLALIVIIAAMTVKFPTVVPVTPVTEAQYLVQFRLDERASAISEAEYLVDFRAAERAMR